MSQFSLYRAYIKQRRPSGSTQSWQTVLPLTISWTDGNGNYTVLEENSTKCGYVPQPDPIYRWVNLPISSDYDCDTVNYIKYYRQKKQVSHDNGATYNDVSPAEYRRGAEYETNSIDCGYVVPTGYKAVGHITDGSIVTIPCGWYALTPSDVSPYTLTDITIGDCVSEINSYTFDSEVSLRSAVIGNNVTRIGSYAFYSCYNLTSVTIGNSVKGISDSAFKHCRNLTSIIIPDSVTDIAYRSFEGCSGLTSVTLSNNLWQISDHLFDFCTSLTSITIPSSVTRILDQAFHHCHGLTSITIPDSVTSIGRWAFGYCRGLRSVYIGSGVTGIGDYAFSDCSGLTNINILATTPPSIEFDTFIRTNDCAICVPAASVNAYKTAWSRYASRIFPISS